jgi:hypothetical protein
MGSVVKESAIVSRRMQETDELDPVPGVERLVDNQVSSEGEEAAVYKLALSALPECRDQVFGTLHRRGWAASQACLHLNKDGVTPEIVV